MKPLIVRVLLCSALFALPAAAQEDRNVLLMKQIYSKLSDMFTMGENRTLRGDTVLVLANPGVILQTDLDLAKQDDRQALSFVLNRVPKSNWYYSESARGLDDIYRNILENRELPIFTLNAAQKQKLKAAKDVLFKNGKPEDGKSSKWEKYDEYADAYSQALDELEAARSKNYATGTPVPNALYRKVEKARKEWANLGFRNEIERANADYATYTGYDPAPWWESLNNRFDANADTVNTNKVGITRLNPNYTSAVGAAGWIHEVLTDADLEKQSSSSYTSYGGGLSGGWGLWRFGGSSDTQVAETYMHSEDKGIAIDMEVKRVALDRPWMDAVVFRSRLWRWKDSAPDKLLLSDGAHVNGATLPQGEVPLLPVAVILARNVKLKGVWTTTVATTYSKHESHGASVGWGPFSIGGHYEHNEQRAYSRVQPTGTDVTFTDPQIIGWICELQRKSPDPDPQVQWPTPLRLEHYPEFLPSYLQLRKTASSIQ